jgi:aminoglycoside phosphotransferase (APT) family kinase protein
MRSGCSGPNWSYLRWLIESNLRRQPGFRKDFRLNERLQNLGQGLFNWSYLFESSGQLLVLRLAKVERGLRTRKEAVAHVNREAATLQSSERLSFPYATPKFICLVREDSAEAIGLIESAVDGEQLSFCANIYEPDRLLKIIAKIAVTVHKLPKTEFVHLKSRFDSRAHVMEQLEDLSSSIFGQFQEAAAVRDWILSHLPEGRPSTVLHSDLLPQNVLLDESGGGRIAIVDWQEAKLGDPAYDLAVVTRGVRKPLGVERGLERIVDLYNQTAEHKLPIHAVIVHELIFHLNWLSDAVKKRAQKRIGGHGPEHYASLLGSILRRAALRE